jgi:hypothetical protein
MRQISLNIDNIPLGETLASKAKGSRRVSSEAGGQADRVGGKACLKGDRGRRQRVILGGVLEVGLTQFWRIDKAVLTVVII